MLTYRVTLAFFFLASLLCGSGHAKRVEDGLGRREPRVDFINSDFDDSAFRFLQSCPGDQVPDHDYDCCLPEEIDNTDHCCYSPDSLDPEKNCCKEADQIDGICGEKTCDVAGEELDGYGDCCRPSIMVDNHCPHDHDVSEATWHKFGAMIVILATGVAGCGLPFIFHKCCHPKLNRFLLAFSAGTFLGLSILHLFSEAVVSLERAGVGFYVKNSFVNAAYPMAIAGFLAMFYLEFVVWIPGLTEEDQKLLAHHGTPGEGHEHAHDESTTDNAVELKAGGADPESPQFHSEDEDVVALEAGDTPKKEKGKQPAVTFSAILLMLAMSIHSVFEGGVIGVAQSPELVWIACAAIVGHKWAEGFALATNFIQNGLGKWWIVGFLTAFVLASPIGIAIGWPLSYLGDGAVGTFSAISLGTLLHVGMESAYDLFHHKVSPGWRHLDFLGLIFGVTLLFVLWLVHLIAHEH